MNSNRILFLLLGTLTLFACKKDAVITETTISVSSIINLDQGVCVGIPFDLVAELRTPTETGIEEFFIVRNNVDTLVDQNVFITPNIDFTFTYSATSDDLDQGNVVLQFILKDRANQTTTETLTIPVEAEFIFRKENAVAGPGWDLVNNEPVASAVGSNVDVEMLVETQPCGFGCVKYRVTFTAGNDTRFYNIPIDPVVNYFSNVTKQQDVLDILSGVTPEESIVVYSDFPEDIGANGLINAFPIVAKIRGTEEYAIMDYVVSSPDEFFYKKRSEFAGQ